jgi:hypothetical protein
MISHKDIVPLVRVEMSGLSKDTDLGMREKEQGYKKIKDFINEKTGHIRTPFQVLNEDGCVSLGKLLDSTALKKDLEKLPIYRGHIKNKLYSDETPIYNHKDLNLSQGMYCWSMSDLIKCKAVTDIASSPLIIDIVSRYLGCIPTCYGINCMFSRGTSGHGTTSRHRDSDDFKFLSLFIYLDDVNLQNGPHVYEVGTHLGNSEGVKGNELPETVKDKKILVGQAGEAFLEDNWGVHYGMTLHPNKQRTCMWVRYGLYDNYTSRNSVNILEHAAPDHTFDTSKEINKYIFRFLIGGLSGN